MKKFLKVAILLLLVVGLVCIGINIFNENKSNSNNPDNKIAKLDKSSDKKNIILEVTSQIDSIYDNSDLKELEERSNLIIIGKIKTIDGAINYNENTKEYMMTSTVGTIKVDKVIKSNDVVSSGDVIKFMRLGGVISVAEYEKTLEPRQIVRQGLDKLTQEEKENTYIKETIANDIQPEVGKTYLIYMDYEESMNRYVVIGMEYGLKEYNKTTKKVKNNSTGKWENNSYSDK